MNTATFITQPNTANTNNAQNFNQAAQQQSLRACVEPVSYTHLTLPTILLV